ncbi:MAG TPA: ABC transporter permease [Gaiellaceae bacterium]|jgi:ribose transport system permease protein
MPDLRRALRTRTYLFALALSVVLLVANVIVLPSFGSPSNFDTNLALFAPFAVVAMAATPAILSGGGGIDISVAVIAGFVSNVLILYLLPHGGWGRPEVAIPIVLAIGAGIGLLNGFSVAVLRYQPVIATLCTLFVLQGVNLKIAGVPTAAPQSWLTNLADGWGPIPGGLVLILAPVVVWLALQRIPYHRTLMAVGGGDATAFSAGVAVARVRMVAYALGGLFAALGGIAIAALLQAADGNAGLEYILISLAAVALGGTRLGGGRGGLAGAVAGAAAIFLVQNFLGALDINAYWLQVSYGLMLIVGCIIGAQLAAPSRAAA